MEHLEKWDPVLVIDKSDLIVSCNPALPGSFHDFSSKGSDGLLLGILRQFTIAETILGEVRSGSTISVFQPPTGMHQFEPLGDGGFVFFLRKMTAQEVRQVNELHNQENKVPSETWILATERDQWMSCVNISSGKGRGRPTRLAMQLKKVAGIEPTRKAVAGYLRKLVELRKTGGGRASEHSVIDEFQAEVIDRAKQDATFSRSQ
jgi:hypothetical protein